MPEAKSLCAHTSTMFPAQWTWARFARNQGYRNLNSLAVLDSAFARCRTGNLAEPNRRAPSAPTSRSLIAFQRPSKRPFWALREAAGGLRWAESARLRGGRRCRADLDGLEEGLGHDESRAVRLSQTVI